MDDRLLWRLHKGPRTVEAHVHEWPHGYDLIVFVDGRLRWSQLFRYDTRDLQDASEQKRRALTERGWTDFATP